MSMAGDSHERLGAWRSDPYLVAHPECVENYLAVSKAMGVEPGVLRGEVALISLEPPPPEVMAYMTELDRRLDADRG